MNPANIPLYHIFLTVARSSSISGAAKSLYISQPAVSKSIKKLEESLGVSLIKRSSKGITLTNEGNILYRYLHSAFETISAGEDRTYKNWCKFNSVQAHSSSLSQRFSYRISTYADNNIVPVNKPHN